jgi:hypothetical protein
MGVNPHGSEEKVKLLLNSSHLEPQAVKPPRHHGGRRLGVVEALLPEKHQAPYLTRQMSKWFYDTSTGTAPRERSAVVLLLEGALVSWLLAMREYGGYEDLRGSDRRSVIPYVHG